MTTENSTAIRGVLQPPPRSTGDVQRDYPLLINWLDQFFRISQSNNQRETSVGNFDPATLPDPASATTASAQNTANEAYILADSAFNLAGQYAIKAGSFTITEGDTTYVHTFAEEEPDTDYVVMINAKEYVGSISVNATLIIEKVYTETDFTVTTNAAPGTGNSVTFDWALIRIGANN